MARRSKQPDLASELHELFLHVPAWWCLPGAGIAYLAVRVLILLLASTSPVYHGLLPSGPLLGCLAAGVVLVAGLTAALKRAERRLLYDKQRGIETIRGLRWTEFEQLTGEAYRRQGYWVTEHGGGGPDGGVDLILHKEGERLLVQCKHWRVYKIGVKSVRELYGVLMANGADGAIFVTSGTYTQEAKDFAAGKPLQLLDGDALCRLILPVQKDEAAVLPISDAPVAERPPIAQAREVPHCPVCSRTMVLRTASRGKSPGTQFWGCPLFPDCRGTRRAQPIA